MYSFMYHVYLTNTNTCSTCTNTCIYLSLQLTDPSGVSTQTLNKILLAPAGNQCGTPVFFLADAPARYNAWDEFVFIVL